jgi:flagellar protein FliO/FliZ
MFDDISTPLKFGLAFVVVLALIALTAWLVRRFGSDRLGSGTTRGRQPRLAVIDAASVDGRRRLVLIRRDNVEHLMMIGGPTDVVVEANIVRGSAPPRDVQPPRAPPATDTLPRAVPLGEGNMWPLQPEPAPAARVEPPVPRAPQRQTPAPPPLAVEESAEWVEEPEPAQPPAMAPPQPPLPPQPAPLRRAARTAQEPFIGLAEELARVQPYAEPSTEARPAGPEARPARREPRMPRSQVVTPPPQQPAPQVQASAPAAEAPLNSPADQNLAEMAQRLEAALRRPAKPEAGFAEPAPRAPQPTFELEQAESEDYAPPPAPQRAPAPAEARPARSEARPTRADKTAAPKSSLYDSLEQEMASLLNRPTK